MDALQDRIRGSLVGGAIGDALGYPVEFIKTYKGYTPSELPITWQLINGQKTNK